MNDQQRQSEMKHFAEEVGLVFETFGVPRMAGRVLGWLLIANPPHQSMHQLVEALQASKASISNSTRLLIQVGFIERVSLPGQRRDHFRIKSQAWYEMMKKEMFQMATLRQLAERGLTLLDGPEVHLKHRLEEMYDLSAFLEREMPALLERWEQEREQKNERRALTVVERAVRH